MNQIKRQLSFSKSEITKLRITPDETKISITSMENLSNELFYEIFDYLLGIDIYEAFSNLNHHFQQLVNSAPLLFKIELYPASNEAFSNLNHPFPQLNSSSHLFKLELNSISNETFIKNSKQFLLFNPHQIVSIHFVISSRITQFCSLFTIDSSFDRLQSLIIERIELNILTSLLIHLADLPRLFSLTVEVWDTFKNLNEAYRLIFALPKLKFIKFIFCGDNSSITLPIAMDKQSSPIEHLIIDYSCTFNELFALISYTPQLRRLNFTDPYVNYSNLEIILPITLSNLTFISLFVSNTTFDEFEIFISKISSKLKVLILDNYSDDMTYLDANRWEELISQYLSELEKFSFKYHLQFETDYEIAEYPGEPNEFTSSFWIKRQWICDVEIDYEEIIFSIRPYKERWYEYEQHKMVNPSNKLSKFMRLIFSTGSFDESLYIMDTNIHSALSIAEIYHVEIFTETFAGTIIEILFALRELDSLKVHSLSLLQPRCLSIQEIEYLDLISKKNQITKVNLEKMNDIEEVYFLMELCPRMTYLKVNCVNNMDIEVLVRLILIKSNHHLRLLSFRVVAADDEIIKKLEKTINSEKLLLDYTIEHIRDDIYLQWK